MCVDPTNRPRRKNKRQDMRRKIYVGMELHKDSIQIAIVDRNGRMESNTKIPDTFKDIDDFFGGIPHHAGIVMESSSVSEAIFSHLRDAGYNPVLSNPHKTRAIVYSKIKTDEIDAKVLAELPRSGYIPNCHIPSSDILGDCLIFS